MTFVAFVGSAIPVMATILAGEAILQRLRRSGDTAPAALLAAAGISFVKPERSPSHRLGRQRQDLFVAKPCKAKGEQISSLQL